MLMPLLSGHERVAQHARQHVIQHGTLYISVLTYFEVSRGWRFNAFSKEPEVRQSALRRLAQFETFCHANTILPLTVNATRIAASVHAVRRRKSGIVPMNDNDLLIAATALTHGLSVVTENAADFQDIKQLTIQRWLDA